MISLIQTAEGALNETHDILQRMRELVVQAGNTGTQETDDLSAIQDELDSLMEELGGTGKSKGISDRTQFNGKDLLTGDFKTGETDLVFQIGANEGQQLTVNIDDMSAVGLGLAEAGAEETDPATSLINVAKFVGNTTEEGTEAYDGQLKLIDDATKAVSKTRSNLGAVQNRLEHTINNLGASSENLSAAESRIRDVDYDLAAA